MWRVHGLVECRSNWAFWCVCYFKIEFNYPFFNLARAWKWFSCIQSEKSLIMIANQLNNTSYFNLARCLNVYRNLLTKLLSFQRECRWSFQVSNVLNVLMKTSVYTPRIFAHEGLWKYGFACWHCHLWTLTLNGAISQTAKSNFHLLGRFFVLHILIKYFHSKF